MDSDLCIYTFITIWKIPANNETAIVSYSGVRLTPTLCLIAMNNL
jgi:hypothetical protein